ncbi:MAG: CRISPR-associated endonuclease Cas2 [Bacteroides sp.]|nr:CRISPR-associated endonuclease Cas2 [Bacteroides sp.]MCM1548735.1 CRISPR-associated endonuclease Cas2 [Clostridium sp.]
MENYFFDIREDVRDDRVFVLVIYDIIDNKRRIRLAKYLQGYGFRIQKSAFEALIRDSVYQKMIAGLGKFVTDEDNVRVYRIIGKGQVKNFGKDVSQTTEDLIII